MKRVIVFCVLISLILFSCKERQKPIVVIAENSSAQMQENVYLVSYYKYLVSNDSVGSQWETVVKYGERAIASKSEIVFEDERLELVLYAIEKDKKMDDVGNKTITFSDLGIGEEETITEFVEVVENGGAYTSNVAVWKFSVTLKRLS